MFDYSEIDLSNINWRSYFEQAILTRGRRIALNNELEIVKVENKTVEAKVYGTKTYTTKVRIEDDGLHARCNCPYAQGYDNCKHIAAVLFKVESQIINKDREAFTKKLTKEKQLMLETEDTKLKNYKNKYDFEEIHSVSKETRIDAIESLKNYQYFNFAKIYESMHVEPLVRMQAEELLDSNKVILFDLSDISFYSDVKFEARGTFFDDKDEMNNLSIKFNREHFLYGKCSEFPYFDNQEMCKHKVALFYLAKEYIKNNLHIDATDEDGQYFLNKFLSENTNEPEHKNKIYLQNDIRLIPKLSLRDSYLVLSFKIGREKLLMLKNITDFVKHLQNEDDANYGSTLTVNHKIENFTPESQKICHFLNKLIPLTNSIIKDMYSRPKIAKDFLYIPPLFYDDLFEAFNGQSVESEINTENCIKFIEKNPEIFMDISKVQNKATKNFDGINCEISVPAIIKSLHHNYFFHGNEFCKISDDFIKKAKSIIALVPFEDHYDIESIFDGKLYTRKFSIGRNNLASFYHKILPQLEDIIVVKSKEDFDVEQYLPPKPEFTFYLDIDDENVICKPTVKYNQIEFSPVDFVLKELSKKDLKIDSFRDSQSESNIMIRLQKWFDSVDSSEKILRTKKDDDVVFDLISNGVSEILDLGQVQVSEKFSNLKLSHKTKISVGVSINSGLLELDISSDDVSKQELYEILQSYQKKKKYHRLKSGDFFDVQDESIQSLNEMIENLHITSKEFLKEKISIPTFRSLYVAKLLEENESIYANRDEHFSALVKDFKTINDSVFNIPKSLKNTLRNYQVTGFKWIKTLSQNHFAGILADDMGLGKTLQVISVLLSQKQEQKKSDVKNTSLIVAPASLIFNWKEEFLRFAPELNVEVIAGVQKERKVIIDNYKDYDCIVTSYDLLKRDIAEYEDKFFDYQIIDEAQYIKNHSTEAAKAVKVIKAQKRLALTGTPIENRLSELWSIFDFLMPGFLYSYENFKKKYETEIVKKQNQDVVAQLQKMISPFILRRLKKDVLKDLPEKLEEVRVSKMEPVQQKLYDAQVTKMKDMLASQKDGDFAKSKIQILAEITRLRQICCDPNLCFENYKGESTKKDSCIELIQNAIEGGHKILLFSQFTSMFDILEKEFVANNVLYYKITGATPKEKRIELVNEFNKNDIQVFLISLKAGGTGLNLTGADVVIHYDPWWNVAVQNQATDRAHRIGQKNTVTVYQLVVKNTIEEKIIQLQKTKKELADQIITENSESLSNFTKEDLLELLG